MDIAAYYLVAFLSAAVLLAVALRWIDGHARRAPIGPASALVAAVAVLTLCLNWTACDLSGATWVREFTRQKLECTEPGGVLVSQGDDDTFPLWYVHDVLHVRPDVVLLDRAMLAGAFLRADRDPSGWYLQRLERDGVPVPLSIPPAGAQRTALGNDGALIQVLSQQLRGKPIFITGQGTEPPGDSAHAFQHWIAGHFQTLPVGLVLYLHPKDQPVDLPRLVRRNEELWSTRITLPDLRSIRTDEELDAGYMSNQYATMLLNFGGLREISGDLAGAEAVYTRLAHWEPQFRPAADALSAVRLQRSKLERHAAAKTANRS
jgi:hypothetical protein